MKYLIALSVLAFGINAQADEPTVIHTPAIANYKILNSSDKDQVCKILTGSKNSVSAYHSSETWVSNVEKPFAKVLSTGEIRYKMKETSTIITEINCVD